MEENKKYCKYCGEIIDNDCVICPKCGKQVETIAVNSQSQIQNQTNGMGIAGMVIGIIALTTVCCGGIGGFLGIIGLALSIIAVCSKNKPKGAAITGIICNSISVLTIIIILAIPSSKSENSNEQLQATHSVLTSQPAAETNDPLSDDIVDVDISGCHVAYIKHEIVENMSGEKCIAIYYEFTNNSDEGKTFIYTISDKAFQDGVELDASWFHVNDESKNADSEIKPGVTITVCSGFVLRDEKSDVELEVKEWISLNDKTKDSMVLSLK